MSSPRRRTASPAHEGSQKRRRLEDGPDDVDQPSTVLAQIATWEIPDAPPSEGSPTAPPVATSSSVSAPVVLSDSADRISPIVMRDSPEITSTPALEPLSTYTCPICFSPPTNATLTPCGHICCGQCLFTAVKSTMRRNMVVAMDRAPVPR